MKSVTYSMLAGIMVLAAAGCSSSSVALKNGELNQTIETPKSDGDYIEALGIGAADPNLPNVTQRKATSRNAAVVDAQYQLVAKIKGVQIEGGITIEKAMETNSKITASVNNMVKGAEVAKLEWAADDGCVASVRLNKKIVEKELGLNFQ